MKTLFLVLLVLFSVVTPVYAQPFLSDATGLVKRFDVQASGHSFEVKTSANFDIYDIDFNANQKRLTFYITSSLENNLGEIIIPNTLLRGNFTFYLNDQEFFPKLNSNEKISFITLTFTGSGEHKLDIIATSYPSKVTQQDEIEPQESASLQKRETLNGSLGWLVLAGSLVIVAAFIIMKIKKRR